MSTSSCSVFINVKLKAKCKFCEATKLFTLYKIYYPEKINILRYTSVTIQNYRTLLYVPMLQVQKAATLVLVTTVN